MAAVRESHVGRWFPDKAAALRFLEEQDARTGFVLDPTATAEEARRLMRACGVRPEENLFSRDIVRAKYPEEDE
jgi:hypothetical protein